MITLSYIGAGLIGFGLGFLIGLAIACKVFSGWLRKNGLQLFPGGEIISNAELVDLLEEQEAYLVTIYEAAFAEEENNGHHPA